MKKIIMINGTMGVGKTATSTELKQLLPKVVFLDGDWCWDMAPFVVNEETKTMVVDNIIHLLNNFLHCTAYENIVFCWVMHEQYIIDSIISKLDMANCKLYIFSLICSKSALIKRIEKDIEQGKRTDDVIERTLLKQNKYEVLETVKINVSNISAKDAAEKIKIIIERENDEL